MCTCNCWLLKDEFKPEDVIHPEVPTAMKATAKCFSRGYGSCSLWLFFSVSYSQLINGPIHHFH